VAPFYCRREGFVKRVQPSAQAPRRGAARLRYGPSRQTNRARSALLSDVGIGGGTWRIEGEHLERGTSWGVGRAVGPA